LFFDYFSHIKGLNDEFIASKNKFGRIKTLKKKLSQIKYAMINFF